MLRINVFRIIVGLSLWSGLLCGFSRPAQAQEQPLTVSLEVLQDSGTVGAKSTWLITLLPAQDIAIDETEIVAADPQHWQLVAPVKTGPVAPSGQVISVSVIPLIAEKTDPAVIVRFRTGQNWQEVYALASSMVDIRRVEDQVTAVMIVHEKTVDSGSQVNLDLQLVNRSPALLENFKIVDESVGLEIEPDSLPLQPLAPFETGPVYHLRARVVSGTGKTDLQPLIRLDYTWQNSKGEVKPGSLVVQGDALMMELGWWQGAEMRGYLLGLIGGLLAATLTRLVEEWINRRRDNRTNRERVIAVLFRLINRARTSANTVSTITLSDMEIIYSDAGLFHQLDTLKLANLFEQAWVAAERFNDGITKPGGAQRKDTLLNLIEQLDRRLTDLREKRGNT